MEKTALLIIVLLLVSLILVGAECGEKGLISEKEGEIDKEQVEEPSLFIKAIIFNDQNKNGVLDGDEERMPNIHLDESRDYEYFGGVLSNEKGEAVWFDLPLDTKITISIPVQDGVYPGWRTVVYWPVTTKNRYDFVFEQEPVEPEIIYFGLSKEEINKEALSVCEKISDIEMKYRCVAMVKKNPTECEILIKESGQDYCNNCYREVAMVTGIPAICDKIERYDVIIPTEPGEEAQTRLVTEEELLTDKRVCQALAERDPTKCAGWVYADYCYTDVAVLAGDVSICNSIKYGGGAIDCKAVVSKDVSFCKGSDSEDCYQMLALLTGDEKVCDGLKKRSDLEWARDLDREMNKCIKMAKREVADCFIEPATGTDCYMIPAVIGDPSLCEHLKLIKDYCQKAYPSPERIQQCEQLGWHLNKDACYFYTAMRIADLLPLELILL